MAKKQTAAEKEAAKAEAKRAEAKVAKNAEQAEAERAAEAQRRSEQMAGLKSLMARKVDNALAALDELAASGKINDDGQVAKFKERVQSEVEQFVESVATQPE